MNNSTCAVDLIENLIVAVETTREGRGLPMNIEMTLLKDLTVAIDAVRESTDAAADAFKVAYAAPVADKVTAKIDRMEADTRAAHAKHELNAALSAARAHINTN